MKILLLAAGLALACSGAVRAQAPSSDSAKDYPNRPLRQIVPAPPGGGLDIATRIVATKWSEILGQAIAVENRPGAGATLGAGIAARWFVDRYGLAVGHPKKLVRRSLLLSGERSIGKEGIDLRRNVAIAFDPRNAIQNRRH